MSTAAAAPTLAPARVQPHVLAAHVAGAAMIQASQQAVVVMLPVVARREFHATNWAMVFITALPTTLFVLSIFWNTLFERMNFGRYLLVFWACSTAPLLFTPLVQNTWQLLALHTVACIGGAGYYPAAGRLIKRLYPDSGRGWVYSTLQGSYMLALAGLARCFGLWLDHDEHAFRVYMPLAAILALTGCGLLAWLGREHSSELAGTRTPRPISIQRLLDPVVHMRSVLKADPTFARYEASFMTYGVGWMICYALLPIMVTDRLGLTYDEVSKSTQVAYSFGVVAALLPWGWQMNSVGPVRISGAAFAGLALYPIGLIFSLCPTQLTLASLVYGIAHAGVSVGWMLGPVALAPTAEKVPHYVAIHATLVGIRGAVFQFLGVLLYTATGSFTWPLAIAALSFVWAAQQMWALDRRMRAPRPNPGLSGPEAES